MLARFGRWILDVWGSRIAIAVFAGLFVAFAAHAITQPERLPPLARIGLLAIGLPDLAPPPPSIEIPAALKDRLSAAERQELAATLEAEARLIADTYRAPLRSQASAYLAENPQVARAINYAGAALSFVGMFGAIALYANTIRLGRARSGDALCPPPHARA